MAEAEFRLRITADAESAVLGARETAAELRKAGGAGAEAGEEAAAGGAAAATKWGDARKAFAELGREVPIVGQIGRVAMNPLAAGAAVAGYAIAKTREGIARLNESLSTSQWETYATVVAAKKQALDDAAASAAAFAREMERLRDATETASEAGEKATQVFRAQQSAQDKVDEARKRLEIAQVETTEKDPVRRRGKLLEIEERYAGRTQQREAEAARFELAQQRQKMENEQAAVGALDKQLETMRRRQAGLKSEGEITARLEVERRRLAKTEDEYDKKTERHDELGQKSWTFRTTPEQMEYNELGGQLDALFAIRARQRQYVSRLEAAGKRDIELWRAGQEEIGTVEGMRRGAAQRAQGIALNLPTQTRVVEIEGEGREAAARMETATRARHALADARGALQQAEGEAAAQVAGHKRVAESLLRALVDGRREVAELERRVAMIEGQAGNGRNR